MEKRNKCKVLVGLFDGTSQLLRSASTEKTVMDTTGGNAEAQARNSTLTLIEMEDFGDVLLLDYRQFRKTKKCGAPGRYDMRVVDDLLHCIRSAMPFRWSGKTNGALSPLNLHMQAV